MKCPVPLCMCYRDKSPGICLAGVPGDFYMYSIHLVFNIQNIFHVYIILFFAVIVNLFLNNHAHINFWPMIQGYKLLWKDIGGLSSFSRISFGFWMLPCDVLAILASSARLDVFSPTWPFGLLDEFCFKLARLCPFILLAITALLEGHPLFLFFGVDSQVNMRQRNPS